MAAPLSAATIDLWRSRYRTATSRRTRQRLVLTWRHMSDAFAVEVAELLPGRYTRRQLQDLADEIYIHGLASADANELGDPVPVLDAESSPPAP